MGNRFWGIVIFLALIVTSCTTRKKSISTAELEIKPTIEAYKQGGGSSGMEKVGENTYIVVYDLKNFQKGSRMGLVSVTEESLSVSPISVSNWGKEGISSDLESICSIPGRENEFLMAESGNWQGKLGRIFHVKVDVQNLKAIVLGSVTIPIQYENNRESTGDQYEAIACLPYNENERVVILGERGGSKNNPNGIIRWGVFNLNNHSFDFNGSGLKGKEVNAPGQWIDSKTKRDITDFHIDEQGGIWAAASEDLGDSGPFYSVVYKLGEVVLNSDKAPIKVYEEVLNSKDVYGFKIESLSGPCQGINSSHCFGTEDEIYGGVWRPIQMKVE